MIRLSPSQRLAWLRLYRSENIGPQSFRRLINHFGGAEAALEALPHLARRGGAARPVKICPLRDAEQELERLTRLGASLVAMGESDFPPLLATEDGAPPILSVLGSTAVLSRNAVAIVGARNASAAGRSFAGRLARDLGAADLLVVSGLARGIDAAAHEASLATGTVAVLAGGLDRLYPPENEGLAARIAEGQGALVSEMPLGWEPRARDFPRRNRIIAGMAAGTVIVEAAKRSGSLITARLAAEMGREVFAVPGSPLDPRCEGSNQLLKDGAVFVTEARDVIDGLGSLAGRRDEDGVAMPEPEPLDPSTYEAGDGHRRSIIELLGPTPVAVDDLVHWSGAPVRIVRLVLLELDVAGRLEHHGQDRVSLRAA